MTSDGHKSIESGDGKETRIFWEGQQEDDEEHVTRRRRPQARKNFKEESLVWDEIPRRDSEMSGIKKEESAKDGWVRTRDGRSAESGNRKGLETPFWRVRKIVYIADRSW